MRVFVIRHHDIDEAGFIGAAFAALGGELSVHLMPGDGPLPSLDGVDQVVVLGAAWSVYDEAAVGSWIGAELAWLRQADQAGVPVLGICFGAQALSAALGGEVKPAPRPEIGWVTVDTLAPEIIEPGPWLEFHEDQCLPPDGAQVLARTGAGVQAFMLRRNFAVQFHPEVDGRQLKRWLDNGGHAPAAQQADLDPAAFVRRTIAEERAAAQRAGRLVETVRRLTAT